MELTVVGCSGSFPGPDSAASCYLAEADGFRMVLDLGSGALGALQRHARLDQIDAVHQNVRRFSSEMAFARTAAEESVSREEKQISRCHSK